MQLHKLPAIWIDQGNLSIHDHVTYDREAPDGGVPRVALLAPALPRLLVTAGLVTAVLAPARPRLADHHHGLVIHLAAAQPRGHAPAAPHRVRALVSLPPVLDGGLGAPQHLPHGPHARGVGVVEEVVLVAVEPDRPAAHLHPLDSVV